jgi:uncharacterized membrane protein YcaP (DUF421 family)
MLFISKDELPIVKLKFSCKWDMKECDNDEDEKCIPTSDNPMIIEFEAVKQELKIWKENNEWFMETIEKRPKKNVKKAKRSVRAAKKQTA